jgi:N-acetylneuraminic acid mutarotase
MPLFMYDWHKNPKGFGDSPAGARGAKPLGSGRFTGQFSAIARFSHLLRCILALALLSAGFSASLPAPVQARPAQPQVGGTWTSTTDTTMESSRANHTATLLPNGKVLVAGGSSRGLNNQTVLSSAELFDPASGEWKATGSMGSARMDHSATLLPNGKVLVVGGSSDGNNVLASAELYDPATGQWSAANSISPARKYHTATLLKNGQLLIAGGAQTGSGAAFTTLQLYDPATNTWSTPANGSGLTARAYHTANLLSDGSVMFIGGESSGTAITSVQIYDKDGLWSNPVNLTFARYSHTATVLTDDSVLVVGGRNSSAVIADSERLVYAGVWTRVPVTHDTSTYRFGHTATLLPNGNALITGGLQSISATPIYNDFIDTAEVYEPDPVNDDFAPIASLTTPRANHTATLLPNGQVVVIGGRNNGDTNNYINLNSADINSFDDPSWSAPVNINTARYSPITVTLKDGRVMVIGGISGNDATSAVQIFNNQSGWSTAQSFPSIISSATATLLPNGKVLVAGGQAGSGNEGNYLNTALLYDPSGNTWTATGSMAHARASHTATLMPNGQVMVAGGQDNTGSLDSVEFYNPNSGTWSTGNHMLSARSAHTTTLLLNGNLLVVGGQSFSIGVLRSTEVYNISSGTWWSTSGDLSDARRDHTATLLPDGKVLIVGGTNNSSVALYGYQVYDPGSNSWTLPKSLPHDQGRTYHSATLMNDGRVLVAGGLSGSTTLDTCIIYDPATGLWTDSPDLNIGRFSHAAALLPDGRVLAAAGARYNASSYEPQNTAEFYDPALVGDSTWQPTITSLPTTLVLSQKLTFSGTNLRGYQLNEASGGGANSSASNVPLVQLRRMDNNQIRWLLPDPQTGFSDTSFTSQPVSGIPAGLAMVTVYVNGMPSTPKVILLENNYTFVPLVVKPGPVLKKFYVPMVKK